MASAVSPQQVDDFYTHGFVILPDVMPVSLIRDLRRQCDIAAEDVRRRVSPQAQRFQPVSEYADRIDLQPFRDYARLPALNEAFETILGKGVFYGHLETVGVFLEPRELPWHSYWHRDMTLEMARLETPEEFARFVLDWDSLNQINCALYDDSCTWYVPGSHLRVADRPHETRAGAHVELNEQARALRDAGDAVGLERLYLGHTRHMPGAVQVHLHAGDLLLYRAFGWHCGNYVPYRKRATILDVLYSQAYFDWRWPWLKGGSPKWKPDTSSEPVEV